MKEECKCAEPELDKTNSYKVTVGRDRKIKTKCNKCGLYKVDTFVDTDKNTVYNPSLPKAHPNGGYTNTGYKPLRNLGVVPDPQVFLFYSSEEAKYRLSKLNIPEEFFDQTDLGKGMTPEDLDNAVSKAVERYETHKNSEREAISSE